ncbi:McrC family protein [Cupriavidus sp. KB_39]|uniref:McrC family protein n=1 Tax=Cupriavidus sp. KB_39 TaxID=3233036 RepID=UPI003F8F66F1
MPPFVLFAFEREPIRVAPDGEVAALRQRARSDGLPPDGRDDAGRLVLTQVEAEALERVNATRPDFCSRTLKGLALSKHCGLVRLAADWAGGSVVLEVLPKIWDGHGGAAEAGAAERAAGAGRARRALLHMLAAASGLSIAELDMAPQAAARATLLDLFIRSYLREALKVAKGGLLTRYVESEGDLPVLRGRMLLVETERLATTRPGLVRCLHDELTHDNPYNQALLAAMACCRPHVRQATTERLWGEARAFFGGVSFVRVDAKRVAGLKRGREMIRYREALRWAEQLLGLLSPSLTAGASEAPTLLFNMEPIFESWVARHERRRAPEGIEVSLKGSPRYLSSVAHRRPTAVTGDDSSVGAPQGRAAGRVNTAFRLMPDVLLWPDGVDREEGTPAAIVDAKWKALDPSKKDWGVDEKDAHQLVAYLTRYGCLAARLAYPALSAVGLPPQGPPSFEIALPAGAVATIDVELVPIDA